MDYDTLTTLRRTYPGWRLLAAEHAPLIGSFLWATFVAPNVRTLSQAELRPRLEDHLFTLRARLGDGAFPRTAAQYLESWAHDDAGWLRKDYPPGSDEAHFDLTPAAEKALDWLAGLEHRALVSTESRLMTVFELLRLVPRRPLGFHLSLLLAMLRKRMAELDASGGETRLVLSRSEIVDLVRLFARETNNEAKMVAQVQTQINKVLELGFLRRLRTTERSRRDAGDAGDDRYEVRRILKAFVDAQFLAELNERLEAYRAHLASGETTPGDGEPA